MGTGSKSSHASYAVGPTASEAPEQLVAEAPEQPMSGEEIQAKADLLVAMNLLEEIADPSFEDADTEVLDDPVERYKLFVGQVEDAQAAIEKLKEAGVSEEEIEAHTKALKAQTVAFLTSLDDEDLREIATDKGFEHPVLVGLSGKGQHPLVHWLDPAYPDDIPSKEKIQAAAQNRYQQLLAGETVGGMTLSEYHDAAGLEPVPSGGSWSATPEEAGAAAGAITKAISTYHHDAKYTAGSKQGEALQTMLAAEHKLATADCPELGDKMEAAKAHAKLIVDQALNAHALHPYDVRPAVEEAVASGALTESEAKHLTAREVVTLMRSTTPETEKTALTEIAAKREQQLENLDVAYVAHSFIAPGDGAPLALPPAGDPGAAGQVAIWATKAGELKDLQHDVHSWYSKGQQFLSEDAFAQHPGADAAKYVHPDALTNDFNAWAKGQKLADLRAVAGEMGMDNNATATRAQVQQYIAASFNPKYDQQAIKEKVSAAAAKKEAAKAAAVAAPVHSGGGLASEEAVQALASKLPAGAAGTAASTPAKPATAAPKLVQPKKAPKPGSFNANIQALMAKVQHAKATSQDVPTRVDAKEVAGWTFGPGTTASALGGTYAKTMHAAPDGSQWLFKADHNHGGALGHTEAAASHVLSLGGVPAVPVYAHKQANGTAGSIQPMLQGAKPFTSSPSQWSQSQVDAIVQSHVGSWFVGEHDGHQDNWLETPSGGLVQIDRGQAWKHFGADKLSIDYAPSGGGGFTPVHQKLYQAALGGGLAKGVKLNPAAAHPVIKKFESMPDAQMRSVLHSTAHEGAKAGVAWVPQMRSRAAKALKIPQSQVTHDQIANAFLDHAVERKSNLRQNFTDFFVKQLKLPSGASLKHGGS
ncbi:hypothetical protein OG369_43115 [Streptomyces sp. NBC_01221]|uniref:hypothetical protein n=1 Tax=Streptomyces sp. NBC_01221 TaxID=2903782 RepID=UPI00224DFDB0|nr:hypothetical protein [Streptomyces sp. NBC_01221]MCX4792569.1 hypothetical protein [Streptomyces sp. NBC_01221]